MTEKDPGADDARASREAEALLVPDTGLGVPRPAFGGRSIANLSAGLVRVLGPPGSDLPPLPPLSADVDPFDGSEPPGTVVLLLVDGLGWRALVDSARRSPHGAASRWLRFAHPISTVFPTTTTVALTSLSTGSAPGQHGVVGHRVYFPKYDSVVEVLRMSPLGVSAPDALVGPGWTPSAISAQPSIFRRGVPATALTRDRYEGSGFTRMLYDGAAFAGYVTGSDFALSLLRLLDRPDPPPLVFAYWEDLDVAQHVRGPMAELVDLEVERMDALVNFVARHLAPERARRTTLLITADHGQVPMAPDHQLAVDRDPELMASLARPPTGDRRATFFAARPGRLPQLQELLETRRGPGSQLLDTSRAVEAGLFGPPPFHPELRDRLGDLLLLLPSPGGVTYTLPGSRPRGHPMLGAHGGLEGEELLVPLVTGTLESISSLSRGRPRERSHEGSAR